MNANKKFYLVLMCVALLILGGVFFIIDNKNEKHVGESMLRPSCIQIASTCFYIERADTNEARIKGLSDRDSLARDSAMLFVFETPAEQCFWMKDMRFSIDMIWLNPQKQITKIEKNVSPATYPNTFCADNAKYVLEVNANQSSELGLKVGDQLDI